jgi:hypothetical protein
LVEDSYDIAADESIGVSAIEPYVKVDALDDAEQQQVVVVVESQSMQSDEEMEQYLELKNYFYDGNDDSLHLHYSMAVLV